MRTACIIGMSNSIFNENKSIITAVTGTLAELGLEVLNINLLERYIPYYEEGVVAENYEKTSELIKDIKNLILAFSVTDYTPCAIMKVFLEHAANGALFNNKNVLIISIAPNTGEKEAADYVSKIVGMYGGVEIVRVAAGGDVLKGIKDGGTPIAAVEKYAEDFYRLTKQNRIFLKSSVYKGENRVNANKQDTMINGNFYDAMANVNEPQGIKDNIDTSVQDTMLGSQEQFYKKNLVNDYDHNNGFMNQQAAGIERHEKPTADLGFFTSGHDDDIEALTRLFATKLREESEQSVKNTGYKMPDLIQQTPVNQPAERKPVHEAQMADNFGNIQDYLTQAKALLEMPEGYGDLQAFLNSMGSNPQAPPQSPPVQQSLRTPTQQQGGKSLLGKKQLIQTNATAGLYQPIQKDSAQVSPRAKTCKQMTQNLPHYFQPQIAQDTEAVFQFIISGEEQFSGYILIKNKDNEYYDGTYEAPDITILADSTIWLNVLKGKFTAQKAFMTGQLKVRGNFMLLNRFDQIYKKM